MKKLILGTAICAVALPSLWAQLPSTQIMLFEYEGTDKLRVSSALFLTNDNREGYNNQPAFVGDQLYITQSTGAADSLQTDIYALDIGKRRKARVTATHESEYSPTPCPDSEHFSVVRVEDDGRQRLWKLPIDRGHIGEPLFPELGNVGYHCWLNNNEVAMFLVDAELGNELVVGDVETGTIRHLSQGIGRCMRVLPDGRLAFSEKASDRLILLKSYDPFSGTIESIAQCLPGCEDFDVLPDGGIAMGYQGHLFRIYPEQGSTWMPILNLARYTKGAKITRLAISGGRIAVVLQ